MIIERKQYLDELIKKKDNGRIKIITGIKNEMKRLEDKKSSRFLVFINRRKTICMKIKMNGIQGQRR